MRKFVLTALAVAACAAPASATIVYSNNFDAENGGNSALNYNGFNGLTVTNGSVDLVKSGDFGITCPGGAGACVDLDGTTSDAGIVSSNSFAFNAGDKVTLSFSFTGNQRGGPPDDAHIKFLFSAPTSGVQGFSSTVVGGGPIILGPFVNQSQIELAGSGFPSNYPLDEVTFFFTAATSGSLNFSFATSGGDNIGPIIDNVVLDIAPVPEPASWAMMIAGFALAGAAARRRSRATVTLA